MLGLEQEPKVRSGGVLKLRSPLGVVLDADHPAEPVSSSICSRVPAISDTFLVVGQNTRYQQSKGGEVRSGSHFSPSSLHNGTKRGAWWSRAAQDMAHRKQLEGQELPASPRDSLL